MAHVPADGVLGVEGIHTVASPSGTSVALHGQHQYGTASWYKLDKITGGRGLGDVDNNRSPAEGRLGEIDYPGAPRGKTKVYEGRICSSTMQGLRQAQTTLERVVSEMTLASQGTISAMPPAWLGGSEGYQLMGKVIAYDCDEEQLYSAQRLPTPYMRKFMLSVRMSDPRHEWSTLITSANQANAATYVLNNQGNAPADLHFIVRPSGAGVALPASLVVENLTTGRSLEFSGMALPNGNHVQIDWKQRSAIYTGQPEANPNPNSDLMPYLDEGLSDWWDALVEGAVPGNNSIKVTAGSGVTWNVRYRHTAW